MKTLPGLLCSIAIAVAAIVTVPVSAKEKDLEVVDAEFQGDEDQIALVETKAQADPRLLRGADPPCMQVPKEKGKGPGHRTNFLCKPLAEPLTTLTGIYQVVITSEGYSQLQPLSMTMSTTSIPVCSITACEAGDNAKCKAWRRSYLHPYKCYDERFLGNSSHECFAP